MADREVVKPLGSSRSSHVARDFAVPRWLRSPHLQTLSAAAPLFVAKSEVHRTLEVRIPLPVPTAEAMHRLHAKAWWQDAEEPRMAVLVLHGIGGSSASRSVVRAAMALYRRGYHVVRLDCRGAGESIKDVPTLYHAGLSSDVELALAWVARQPRVAGAAVLGFSGGGAMALKLASEWGDAFPSWVRGIATVSAPLDYTVVAPRMETLGCLPYRFHVLGGLVAGARAFAKAHPDKAHYRPTDVRRLGTFREYDGRIIVPMHGFSDVDAYYEAASVGPQLGRIRVPSLVVHSDDDPMVPGWTVRPWLAGASSAVNAEISAHGGHVGWIGGLDETSWVAGWAVRQALGFFDAIAP